MKSKKYIVYTIIFLVTSIVISFLFSNDILSSNSLLVSQLNQEDLIYDYKIPNNIDVKGITSPNKVIIEENRTLYTYNLDKNIKEMDIAKVSNNTSIPKVENNEKGYSWIEEGSSTSKIFYKSNNSLEPKLIDESNDPKLTTLSMGSRYIVYSIVSNNSYIIKYYNLNTNKSKNIAIYSLSSPDEISPPSGNDSKILWSKISNDTSTLYEYNISKDSIRELENSSKVFNPTFIGNNIFGIRNQVNCNSETDEVVNSNYIVQYDEKDEMWDKFKRDVIPYYIEDEKESITKLPQGGKLLYWTSSLSNGYSFYNPEIDEFIKLVPDEYKDKVTILYSKDNIILYKVQINDKTSLNLIYNAKSSS